MEQTDAARPLLMWGSDRMVAKAATAARPSFLPMDAPRPLWRLCVHRAIFVPMRRSLMPPARSVRPRFGKLAVTASSPGVGVTVAGDPGARREAGAAIGSTAASGEPLPPPPRRRLLGPLPAMPRLRRLFDPRGWFRRLEREVNFQLSAHIYPRVPGIALPYAVQLDRLLTVSEAEIPLAGLPAPLDGVKVLLITDIHVGPFLRPDVLRRAFDRLRTLAPDLIVIGGDITTARLEEILPHLGSFRSLTAPLGTFAVLGNHDHYTGQPAKLSALLEENGVTVLTNRWAPIEQNGARFALAGIDDLVQGRPDLAAALDGAPAPTVLLSHNPDIFFDAARRGVALVLSGHTHAGQIRIPGLPVLVRQSRYRLDEGRYTAAGAELVVSRGLGASGLPLRFACSPEAVLLRLVAR